MLLLAFTRNEHYRKRKEGSLSQNSHFLLGFGIAKVRRKKSESVEIDPSTASTSSVH